MRPRYLLGLAFSVLCAALPTHATAVAEKEISHLLDYLGNSGCRFYRNGVWHDALEAKTHLDRKYRKSSGAKGPDAADRFIMEIASKSSLSGEPYRVECQGSIMRESGSWFREELTRYREEGNTPR